MKILHQDARNNEIKLMPETVDDLWHLQNLVDGNDLVFAHTYRRKEERQDKLRPDRAEKVRMRLGIRVDKVEFHESDGILRILGRIEAGPQDVGQHHTLMLSPGDDITVIKQEWKPQHFERIKRAIASSERPKIVFVAIEDTEAVIAAVRDYGLKEVATITRNPTGKMYDAKPNEEEYLSEVVSKLGTILRGEPLIILGPGFTKEALAKAVRDRLPEAAANMSVVSTGQAGMAGIHELMKKGIGGKVLEDTQVARETRLMEQLFAEIGRDGLFAYGDAQVSAAAEAGAISVLMILDTKLRTPEVDRLIKLVESAKGEFHIISSMHEAGRRLASLGGVAALLRYRVQ